MGASRRAARLAVAAVASASALAGCDAILGLDQYSVVACAEADCGVDAGEGGGFEAGFDGTLDGPSLGDADSGPGTDATIDSPDAIVYETSLPDIPLTALETLWARWPMPNPDAAADPDGDPLPSHTTYTWADAGKKVPATVSDTLTGLTWYQVALPATSAAEAEGKCSQPDAGFHAPSRIQLVSLVDFTRSNPAIDPWFGLGGATVLWTATPPGVPDPDAGWIPPPLDWTVDFSSGLAEPSLSAAADAGATAVLCVRAP